MVEHGDAVGGEPHVALQTGGAEPQGQLEGLERVLLGVGPCAAVGEGDRVVEEGGEPLLHACAWCHAPDGDAGLSVRLGP